MQQQQQLAHARRAFGNKQQAAARCSSSSSSSSSSAACRRPVRVQRASRLTVAASSRAVVKDAQSGVEWPLGERFWEGAEMRCLGSSTREKQILIIKAQIYAVALYVEAELAAKELGIRSRGGFFENDGDFCAALADGAFSKVLAFEMLRDIEGQQFSDAVSEKLGPRVAITGDTPSLTAFGGFFTNVKLSKGTKVLCLWNKAGALEVVIMDAATAAATQLERITPPHVLQSQGFARALFELFLGEASVTPLARPVWAAGARALLESEEVRRESRKAGGG